MIAVRLRVPRGAGGETVSASNGGNTAAGPHNAILRPDLRLRACSGRLPEGAAAAGGAGRRPRSASAQESSNPAPERMA